MRSVSKTFGVVRALKSCDLKIAAGEIVGVVGHNGAGKSTMMNVLVGIVERDEGDLTIGDAQMARDFRPHDTLALGVRCVFQELSLCGNLDAVENMLLTHPGLAGPLWRKRSRKLLEDTLDSLFPGHSFPLNVALDRLTIAERQMIEIARAFAVSDDRPNLVVLDEPTSALDGEIAGNLLSYLRTASSMGTSVILISHKLNEVLEVCDRIVVMRDGTMIRTLAREEFSRDTLFELMGSRVLQGDRDPLQPVSPEQQIRVHLDVPFARGGNGDFSVKAGEVVGLAGLEGQGQKTLLEDVFALARHRSASVNGSVAYVAGDRQREGIFPLWSIMENISIGALRLLGRLIPPALEQQIARDWFDRLGIHAPSPETSIISLSGGNQQKVLIARAFASDADIILLDDPTRGVDLGTKQDLYRRIRSVALEQGKSIIWYSTENEEFLHCHRVFVLWNGTITDELAHHEIDEARLVRSSFGAAEHT